MRIAEEQLQSITAQNVVLIMPSSPDVDLNSIEKKAKKEIEKFGGSVEKVEVLPVAFGLKSVNIMFIVNEDKGNTDELEAKISKIKNVESVTIKDVRRAIG